jgi:hypothetical protein
MYAVTPPKYGAWPRSYALSPRRTCSPACALHCCMLRVASLYVACCMLRAARCDAWHRLYSEHVGTTATHAPHMTVQLTTCGPAPHANSHGASVADRRGTVRVGYRASARVSGAAEPLHAVEGAGAVCVCARARLCVGVCACVCECARACFRCGRPGVTREQYCWDSPPYTEPGGIAALAAFASAYSSTNDLSCHHGVLPGPCSTTSTRRHGAQAQTASAAARHDRVRRGGAERPCAPMLGGRRGASVGAPSLVRSDWNIRAPGRHGAAVGHRVRCVSVEGALLFRCDAMRHLEHVARQLRPPPE